MLNLNQFALAWDCFMMPSADEGLCIVCTSGDEGDMWSLTNNIIWFDHGFTQIIFHIPVAKSCGSQLKQWIRTASSQWARSVVCGQYHGKTSGPNFIAPRTVSTESALTEAGNSPLTASVFHRLVTNFGFCACVLRITRHSALTRLQQKFSGCT